MQKWSCSFDVFVWQICDFGLAKWKAYSDTNTTSRSKRVGTVTHTPPEIWRDINELRTVKYDVYSFAVLLWELITEEQPYKQGVMFILLSNVMSLYVFLAYTCVSVCEITQIVRYLAIYQNFMCVVSSRSQYMCGIIAATVGWSFIKFFCMFIDHDQVMICLLWGHPLLFTKGWSLQVGKCPLLGVPMYRACQKSKPLGNILYLWNFCSYIHQICEVNKWGFILHILHIILI